jgi:tetratricopeptide (TPR) repeat protein
VLVHARELQLASAPLSQLLSHTGSYLWGRGLNVLRARKLHEEALVMRQGLYDGDHRDVAWSMNELAIDLHDLRQVARARELHEQALAMLQRLHDGDHPDVALALSNLGNDMHDLGKVARARELHEQALAMLQRLHSGDHRDLVMGLNNLAIDLRVLRKHGRARELHEQALAMLQRLFKGDHPEVVVSLNNLAIDLRALKNHGGARELHEQALAMLQRLHDGDHRDVVVGLHNLAIDLNAVGDHEQARELDAQASAMLQRLNNMEPPSVIELLQSGQRALAAAITEAEKKEDPSDAEARNDYGFCILPDHPALAMKELDAAIELGYPRPEITLANQMFGLFLLQRYAPALDAAERLFQQDRRGQATLWDWRGIPDFSLIRVEPRCYAAHFALKIAQTMGNKQAIDRWARQAERFELEEY